MKYFDSHVHSEYSLDSKYKLKDLIKDSIQKNLFGIAVTDHLDYDYPGYDDLFNINFFDYYINLEKLKKEYKDVLKVSIGIEVGLQEHVIEKTLNVIDKHNFDFVIASLHIVNKTDMHNGDYCRNKTKKDAYYGYFNEMYNIVKIFNNYDVIGHFDLIRRYGFYDDNTLPPSLFNDYINEILKLIIMKGKGIEVNTSGYKYNLSSTLPDFDVIKRYKELGGEIITIGSDAHEKDFLAHKFDTAKKLLNEAGFNHYCYFVNRKPKFLDLK